MADREYTHLVRVDGREGVGLAVFKESGANTVRVSRVVQEAIQGIGEDLPGVEVRMIFDEAALVEDAISDVEQAALLGIVLAIGVLVLFLRSPGPTLIVATAVPVSLLTTLFLMHFGGQSLNVMTLGGLALGAGMLVDNAIVVVESIFRRRSMGDGPVDAAARGTGHVAGAIVASTLTTCAVFLPIVFVRGLAARLVNGLAFTVVVSLLASLFVAVLLIPALSGWLLPKKKVRAIDPGVGRMERIASALLRTPGRVVFLAAALAMVGVWLLSSLGSELLPPADPRQFTVRIIGPPGQRVESTARVSEAVEEILREAAGDDLRALLSEVGRIPEDDRFIRAEQTEENTARIMIRLAAGGRSAKQIADLAAPVVAGLQPCNRLKRSGRSAPRRSPALWARPVPPLSSRSPGSRCRIFATARRGSPRPSPGARRCGTSARRSRAVRPSCA